MDYGDWHQSPASNTSHVNWDHGDQVPPVGNAATSLNQGYAGWRPGVHMPVWVQHNQPSVPPRHSLNIGYTPNHRHTDPEPQCYIPPIVPSQTNHKFHAWRNQELQIPQYQNSMPDRIKSPSWSASPPGTPAPSLPSTSTSAQVPQQLILPPSTQADDDSEPDLPEASQLFPRINPNPAPRIDPQPNPPPAPATNQPKSNNEITPDQGHRPWTNDEIGVIIDSITDPDHPEYFELTQAKGFNTHVAGRWSQFSNNFLKGQRSGRATWTKFKEIKDTYREVRDLHTQTGNGGLLQLEDNDSKAETMQKLSTRLKKLENRVGKLKHVTDKEVYYNWVKGGQSSWFARMHSLYADDMALQRPIERSSGRLSPLIQIEAADDDTNMWESLDRGPQRRHSTTPDARSITPDAPSTPSSIAQSSIRGKKRKLGARSGSEAPDGPEPTSSKVNKLIDRISDALPPSVPPSIHERRLALDEKRLDIEDKRADKNTSILEKRLELEIKQLETESMRRQRRWDLEDEDRKRQDEDRKRRCVLEDEDRKRRQAEDDSMRGASAGRANIEFLLKLAKSTTDDGVNEALRKHAEAAAFTLVDALTRQTLEGLSKRQDSHSSNADVDMDGNPREV